MRRGRTVSSLRGARVFQALLGRGVRVRAGAFRACALPGPGGLRVGFAISRRRVPRAVDRNRLKRLVRTSLRETEVVLDGQDILVLAEREAAALGNAQVRTQLEALWQALARRTRSRQTVERSP